METTRIRPVVGARSTSDWLIVDQTMIDAFANATLDHQWIHVDAERARSGPFGSTIAHGFLTLSLASYLMTSVIDVTEYEQTINYGLNRVRFSAPVLEGSAVRARVEVLALDVTARGTVMRCGITLELRDSERAACHAETLTLLPATLPPQ